MKMHALTAWALLSAAAVSAQTLGSSAPAELEEPLRENVSAFYDHFRRGEFRQAEAYVDEESKDLFYGSKKSRIINFEIKTIDYTEDFRTAEVLVSCRTMVPMLGSQPLDVPLSSTWKYGEGEWLMHLKQPSEIQQKSFSSPFGSMAFDKTAPGGGQLAAQQAQVKAPTIESVKQMYRVNKQALRFAGSQATAKRTVEVENRSIGNLKLESFNREIEGLTVVIDKPELGPGETAVIEITYDPKVRVLQGRQRLEFMVMPITQRFSVFIDF